jgi:hypothetical protein
MSVESEPAMAFTDHLSLILEDQSPRCHQHLENAHEILRAIDVANQQISILHNKLRNIKRKINGELAIGIRKRDPRLNVAVNPKQCKIGYKSKYLSFYPDIDKGLWLISSDDPKFASRFKKMYRMNTIISSDIDGLVSSIADYFFNHYRSLGEDMIGNGLIIVEGKTTNLSDLAKY